MKNDELKDDIAVTEKEIEAYQLIVDGWHKLSKLHPDYIDYAIQYHIYNPVIKKLQITLSQLNELLRSS